jgi:serine/threonine protein kinase
MAAPRHAWLRALGRDELPARIQVADSHYEHLRTYKHDFFAATGLYSGPGGCVILKVGRTAPLAGVPMEWLGRFLAEHEEVVYQAVHDLPGVPRYLGRWEHTGLIHEYVEGHPLQPRERVDDLFFPRLAALLDALHKRNIAYVDLEKRENIIVDDEGQPHLIDFQISWYWPGRNSGGSDPAGDRHGTVPSGHVLGAGACGFPPLAGRGRSCRQGLLRLIPDDVGRFLLARFQEADEYHLFKLRRRHQPDSLTADQWANSYRHGLYIGLHRRLFRPVTLLRRHILKLLTGRSRSPKQEGKDFVAASPHILSDKSSPDCT